MEQFHMQGTEKLHEPIIIRKTSVVYCQVFGITWICLFYSFNIYTVTRYIFNINISTITMRI